MNIALLSCRSLTGYISDEQLLVDELCQHGHQVELIPWDENTDWQKFDLAIIRTTWDYIQRADEFMAKLKLIATQTKLYNSAEVAQWNIHKEYLGEMEKKGTRIVPTVFFKWPGSFTIPADWKDNKFILKPCVSASAWKTMVVSREDITTGKVHADLHDGAWMLQPFLEEIKQGEISLHYFAGKFSHAIVKVPKAGDFRVQEEHGGDIISYTPSPELEKLGAQTVASIPHELLYARVDLVPVAGDYLLMELELIEPALYFRTHKDAPRNFRLALESIISGK